MVHNEWPFVPEKLSSMRKRAHQFHSWRFRKYLQICRESSFGNLCMLVLDCIALRFKSYFWYSRVNARHG